MPEREQDPTSVARAAWPELDVPDEVFVAYLAERRPDGVTRSARVPLADLYLACACVRGDAAAHAALERTCIANLVDTLTRRDVPRAVAEDAVQNVRQKLMCEPSVLVDYQGAGSLAGWVKMIAIREALQILRKERPLPADLRLAEVPVPDTTPELEHLRRVYHAEFQQALLAALGELAPRDRNILRQQYVYRMTIDQIGALHGVHRVTASRWEVRAREQLLERTRRRLMRNLRVDARALDSILVLIHSQLHVSLVRYLGEDE